MGSKNKRQRVADTLPEDTKRGLFQKRRNLKREVQKAYARYTVTLNPGVVLDPDAMTAKVVAEGSIAVALGLMAEAKERGDLELYATWQESLTAARDRLIEAAELPRLTTRSQYDYDNQAWILDGVYVTCGHPSPCQFGCYGTARVGEPAPNIH